MSKRHNVPWRNCEKGTPEWNAWIGEIEAAVGYKICGRQNRVKNPGPGPCESPPAKGRDCCRLHGGATPIGPASVHWKTGARSKLTSRIPQRYLETFDESMSDPELISCRHALSMLQSRREELYSQLDTGESGEAWALTASLAGNMIGLLSEARTALEQKNPMDLQAAFKAIEHTAGQIINLTKRGLGDRVIWKEIKEIGEFERKQRRQEQLLLEAHQHSIERERVDAILMRLLSIMQASALKHAPRDVANLILTDASDGVNKLLESTRAEAA